MKEEASALVKSEQITKDNDQKAEYYFFDENGKAIFLSKEVFKKENRIVAHLYSYNEDRNGLTHPKIRTIEFIGWKKVQNLPKDFRNAQNKIRISAGRFKNFSSFLKRKFPKVNKLTISKKCATQFDKNQITFNWGDLREILITIDREKSTYSDRNTTAINNALSKFTDAIDEKYLKLKKGNVSNFFSLFYPPNDLSEQDIESILPLINISPKSRVSITRNFVKTKNRINYAYLEDVIKSYKTLLRAKNNNEKDWQKFLKEHGWILNSLFPFPVILFEDEAYVGGKTLQR